MKKYLILAAILAVGSVVHAADLKIGIVNMDKIFREFYKTEEAKKNIEAAQTEAQDALKEKLDVFNKNRDAILELDKELAKEELSQETKEKKAKERNEKAEEYRRMEREIIEFRNARLKALQDQAKRMRDELVQEIRKAVDERIKSKQFDIVFDRSGMSANGVEVVLYSRASDDFSEEVIKDLNGNRPKPTPTPEPTATPKPAPGASPSPTPDFGGKINF